MKIKLILIGAVLVAFLCGTLYIITLRAENKQYQQEAMVFKQEAESLRREAEANRKALEQREMEQKAIRAESDKLKAELEEVYKNDKAAGEWACGLIPDSVCERLFR